MRNSIALSTRLLTRVMNSSLKARKPNSMPTEKRPSITSSAASQITATFSRPKIRPLAARWTIARFCTLTPALVWSTTRFW